MKIETSETSFYTITASLVALWFFVFEFAFMSYLNSQKAETDAAIFQEANHLRMMIETEINIAAFLATGVESYIVARDGQVNQNELNKILALIYARGPYFRNIGIAPGNQISIVYPFAGNEAAIGLRYEDNSAQWPSVKKIIESKQGLLAGPLMLAQGGTGLIYRAPVYIDQHYWGLLSTVIDADRIFELIGGNAQPSFLLAIRGKDAKGAKGDVFYGDPALFEDSSQRMTIAVPGGEWLMAFKATGADTKLAVWMHVVFFVLALVFAVASSMLTRMWITRKLLPSLKATLEQRTTELKETNRLFESVLSSANSFAIIAMDSAGRISLFNRGAERMLGYTSEELVGKASFSICLSEQNAEIALFKGLEHEAYKIQESVYKHKNCENIHVLLAMSPIKNDQGVISGYLAIAEDITERKRIEQMKNEFISTVSHELRTPLTAISGALGLIKGGIAGPLPDALSKMLDVAFNNSQRLNVLINDLLDMEKLLAGKMSFHIRTQPLRPLLEHALEANQSYADQYDIHLQLLDCASEIQVAVDDVRFAQVMANLLSNAAKFSPRGAQVDIRASLEEGRVRIAVRDYGQGIAQEFHSRIFQKFSQADSSDSRQKGGTGLGLAISRELVERMHGEIGFQSTSAGTEFFFYLPASV